MPQGKTNIRDINILLSLLKSEKTVTVKYKYFSLAAKELGVKEMCENFAQRHAVHYDTLLNSLTQRKGNTDG